MKQFRCVKCNRLLAKHEGGKIEIKCPRCKRINSTEEQKSK